MMRRPFRAGWTVAIVNGRQTSQWMISIIVLVFSVSHNQQAAGEESVL